MNLRLRGLVSREQNWCLLANRWGSYRGLYSGFALVSRLGDGVAWYALMLASAVLRGREGRAAALHMLATALIAALFYRWLKQRTQRPRPYARDRRIQAWVAPLDEFSFPSGHTLHAVCFTVIGLSYYPALAPLLIPFTGAVAISRVVLGLHYPSDVLAAIALGALLSSLSLGLAGALW